MRILLVAALRLADADIGQKLINCLLRFLTVQVLVKLHGFLNLVADGLQRVQGGHRILHDHRDLPAADLSPVLIGVKPCQLPAVVGNAAAGDPSVCRIQAHQRRHENRLSGARLADNGKALALIDIQ